MKILKPGVSGMCVAAYSFSVFFIFLNWFKNTYLSISARLQYCDYNSQESSPEKRG